MTGNVIIIGAGLAGLACALRLNQHGIPFQILEASDDIGGRVRTDHVDGFCLDRGFQVLLTAYPEARRVLDFEKLKLRSFLPGAIVRQSGQFYEMTDPWRFPIAAMRSLWSPVGTISDKLRIALLRSRVLRGKVEDQFEVPEMTTFEDLERNGFSPAIIEHFFRPFLGGVFLDPQLSTSNRMFRFVFRMFATGMACLPQNGMHAIPLQLAASLPEACVRLRTPVASLKTGCVTLNNGETVNATAVIVAVDGSTAARLLNRATEHQAHGVTCLYFAADKSPIDKPMLLLNGDSWGPINNLCVPTDVSPSYGPKDQSLVSVSVLGIRPNHDELLAEVIFQLNNWFGPHVKTWRHLRTYSIPYALPAYSPQSMRFKRGESPLRPGIYVCGDHQTHPSIEGAIHSGQRAADCVIRDLSTMTRHASFV